MRNLIIILGFCAATITAYFVLFGDKSAEDVKISPQSDRTVLSNSSSEKQPVDEFRDVVNDETIEQLIADEQPLMDEISQMSDVVEARSVARISADMSDTQMLKFENLRAGTIVRNVNGTVRSPYVERRTCRGDGDCILAIVDSVSNKIVWSGEWVDGFVETGVGQEVVKQEQQ